MQVVIFDKFFKCIYRLKNIPRDWHFDKVANLLGLSHSPQEYAVMRFADYDELCIDDYMYKDGELKLVGSNCNPSINDNNE